MEEVIIIEDKTYTKLYINQHIYYGYTINNKQISIIKDDLFSLLNMIQSKKENIIEFFLINSIPTNVYIGNKEPFNLWEIRSFNYKGKRILCSLIALLCVVCTNPKLIPYPVEAKDSIVYYLIEDYSLEQIKNLIYTSPNLTEEEKDFLYNPVFLSLVINTVNQSAIAKNNFLSYMTDIAIKPLIIEEGNKGPSGGQYKISTPNTIYVNSYKKLTDGNKETVAHEYVHLCQDTTGYNMIIESCAEIISHEFFSNTHERSYSVQVRLIKKLMEVIGTDAVWYYNFTGDFTKIEEEVKPYLSKEEYQDFLNALTFDYEYDSKNNQYDRLNELIGILYQNKYHENIEDNTIFTYIDKGDFNLTRYYFNPQLKQESYYLDYNQGEYKEISYEEAINQNRLQIIATQKNLLTKEEAFEMIESKTSVIERKIKTGEHNITMIRSHNDSYKEFVTIIVDGIRYENVDIDQLVKEGIIEIEYYSINQKTLTYEEYVKKEYPENAEIHFIKSQDTELKENSVVCFMPKKIILPPVIANTKSNQKTI